MASRSSGPITFESNVRSPAWPWRNKQNLVFVLCLFIATLAIYYPVRTYPFLDIDDHHYVTDNPHVVGPLNFATVKWAFTHTIGLNYSPLTLLVHNIDVRMFALDPGRHHQMNVLLHAFNAVLLLWVLKRATGHAGRSFVVAALFALHPVQVENVAWIAELKTLLSTLFFFVALGAYGWYSRQPRLRRMALVAFLFGLGLLAKPQVITMPFVLLLWDYWPLQRMFAGPPDASTTTAGEFPPRSLGALLKEKIPLFIIAVLDAGITMIAQHAGGPQPYSLSIRVGNAVLSYLRYLRMALWPAHLGLLYLHPGRALPWLEVWAALLLLIAMTAFVIAQRRHRYLPVGWFWFLGTMVPMIGLVQVDIQALADRYAYVSFIGLFLMICWGVTELAQQRQLPRFALPAAAAVLLLTLSALTYRQLGYWRDPITLWSHSLEVNPRNWGADFHLGFLYWQRGERDLALKHYYHGAGLRPRDSDLYLDIASIEHERGNLPQAILYYRKALTYSTRGYGDVQILTKMAQAYRSMGDEAHARECFDAAAKYVPPPTTRSAINWQADWWRDLIPLAWNRFRNWILCSAAASSGK